MEISNCALLLGDYSRWQGWSLNVLVREEIIWLCVTHLLVFQNCWGKECHAALRCGAWLLWGQSRLCVPSSAAAWLRPPKLRLKELCLLAYEAGRLGNQGSRKAGKSHGRRSSITKATSNHFLWKRAKSSKAAADHTFAPAGGSGVIGAAGNRGLLSLGVQIPRFSHAS